MPSPKTELCRFEMLFSPFRLGSVELPNRLILSPMQTCHAEPDGNISDRLTAYYAARARGGVGCIILESASVTASGCNHERCLRLFQDHHQAGFEMLIDTLHKEGSKVAVQLNHAGRLAPSAVTREQPVAPSPIAAPAGEEPKEMTVDELRALILAFASAAERARNAGADAIELHGAHGNLIGQFLSPASNQRTDDYGGAAENRTRFLIEILRAIRSNVGEQLPISVRLSAEEYVKGGITTSESIAIARLLESAGVQAIHVSAGSKDTSPQAAPTAERGSGVLLPIAGQFKSSLTIPVIAAGRIVDAETAERALQQGQADLIAMGRALIADPQLPSKVQAGRAEEVIPCIGCNNGCVDRRFSPENYLHCLTNPFAGREAELPDLKDEATPPAAKPDSVVVIGGGIAGMQAAHILARRGHKVTLFEKEDFLGGQFLLASLPTGKASFADFITYLSRQLEKHAVTVKLNHAATVEDVLALQPRAVIVASGAVNQPPDVPGTEHSLVAYATELLSGKVKPKQNVVIIGANAVGLQLADMLSQLGKYVRVVEEKKEIACDMVEASWEFYRPRLEQRHVPILTEAKLKRIRSTNVFFEKDEHTLQIDADQVVFTHCLRGRDELVARLQERVDKVYVVGDAKEPRTAYHAVLEGTQAALRV